MIRQTKYDLDFAKKKILPAFKKSCAYTSLWLSISIGINDNTLRKLLTLLEAEKLIEGIQSESGITFWRRIEVKKNGNELERS